MTRGSLSSSHSQQTSRANERKLPVREEVAHELPECDLARDTRVGGTLACQYQHARSVKKRTTTRPRRSPVPAQSTCRRADPGDRFRGCARPGECATGGSASRPAEIRMRSVQ